MSNLKKKCILIVDDDPYSMLLLKSPAPVMSFAADSEKQIKCRIVLSGENTRQGQSSLHRDL